MSIQVNICKCVLSSVVFILAVSCSVKEDRSGCPCMLMLDFSNVDKSLHVSEVCVTSESGFIYQAAVPSSEYDKLHIFKIPSVNVFLNVFSGIEGNFNPERGVTVSEGMDFPPLYLYSYEFDPETEVLTLPVFMHKEYCGITLFVKADGPFSYSLSVEGDVCGVGLSGEMIDGPFRFSPVRISDGKYHMRVPRQKSPSLVLKIYEDDSVLRTFAIGEYIVESGYDWQAENLADVEVEIDYSRTEVVFSVDDWEKTITFDVEI